MSTRREPIFAALAALAVLAAISALDVLTREADAHIMGLPLALLTDPDGTGTIVDQSFTFHWIDSDRPLRTGTATIDISFIRQNPPTFPQGMIPAALTSTAIVQGVLETDTANSFTWDTSQVPTGTYWLWSIVHDPPGELNTVNIITLSPGVLTVVHGQDPVPPSVIISKPDSPFRWSDDHFPIGYNAFDPDGTGRVKLEASKKKDGTDFMLLADNLPAVSDGMFDWDTRGLDEADWTLRATITDARGMSFTAYGRYFLLVTHIPPAPDSGVLDTGPAPADASTPDVGIADAGQPANEPAKSGCACVAPSRTQARGGSMLIAAALLFTGWYGRRHEARALRLRPRRHRSSSRVRAGDRHRSSAR